MCATLQLTFSKINKCITKTHIAQFFDTYGIVEKVNYKTGQPQGYVRFIEEINPEEVVCRIRNECKNGLFIEGTQFSIKLIRLATFVGNEIKLKEK